jgi:hypothetical protein
MNELLALITDWSLIAGFVAGFYAGYFAFFKENDDLETYEKVRRLHRHGYTHH